VLEIPLVSERPYVYSPLVHPLDIRFVILHPAAFSSPIEINILHPMLSSRKSWVYYCWVLEKYCFVKFDEYFGRVLRARLVEVSLRREKQIRY
jgi:hypothetical protein